MTFPPEPHCPPRPHRYSYGVGFFCNHFSHAEHTPIAGSNVCVGGREGNLRSSYRQGRKHVLGWLEYKYKKGVLLEYKYKKWVLPEYNTVL